MRSSVSCLHRGQRRIARGFSGTSEESACEIFCTFAGGEAVSLAMVGLSLAGVVVKVFDLERYPATCRTQSLAAEVPDLGNVKDLESVV
mgnify:CR=1 FL=1